MTLDHSLTKRCIRERVLSILLCCCYILARPCRFLCTFQPKKAPPKKEKRKSCGVGSVWFSQVTKLLHCLRTCIEPHLRSDISALAAGRRGLLVTVVYENRNGGSHKKNSAETCCLKMILTYTPTPTSICGSLPITTTTTSSSPTTRERNEGSDSNAYADGSGRCLVDTKLG